MATMIDLHAGLPVSDLAASRRWYEAFFGRAADFVAGDELLWEIAEHAWVFIEPRAEHAGSGRVTISTTDLDALLAGLAERGIAHGEVHTYGNGVRHVTVLDPDGNSLSFAQAPAA
jgi:catechol 2,3-dioxygenase-like lactoylglutathione lyase family enzyme